VSNQIKLLERAVGVPLLIRRHSGVDLTPAGELFLEHARLVLEVTRRAVEAARLGAAGKRGLLRVGTGAVGVHSAAARLLREFRGRFPQVELEIHPGYAPENTELLARGELDAAIVGVPGEGLDRVRYLRLGTIELPIAVPAGHRLAAAPRISRNDLRQETFVEWPRSTNPLLTDHIHRQLFGNGEPRRRIESPDGTDASRLLLVAKGVGLTVAGFPQIADLRIPDVVFRRLEDPVPTIEYGVAWSEGHVSPILAAFVALAREVADEEERPPMAVPGSAITIGAEARLKT
jgi:DNA-binding transcriptional LysR family regulator